VYLATSDPVPVEAGTAVSVLAFLPSVSSTCFLKWAIARLTTDPDALGDDSPRSSVQLVSSSSKAVVSSGWPPDQKSRCTWLTRSDEDEVGTHEMP